MNIQARRLKASESVAASSVARVMADIFGEGGGASPTRLAQLLEDDRFWFYGAFENGNPVGGLTAHVLPMTNSDGSELFIYDIAVQESHQRRGIGRKLMQAVLEASRESGFGCVFVPAENEDQHALDFYRALGGEAQVVTFFNF